MPAARPIARGSVACRSGRTPFFVVYRPTPERIEILRVFDGRSFEAGLED
jgi:hypothetical protein